MSAASLHTLAMSAPVGKRVLITILKEHVSYGLSTGYNVTIN